MTVDLTQLWHTNRRWRSWMDKHTKFVTPDTLDCLRYALIESCEALDAWMRARLPDHARNNGRDHTVESELADTAMLLLTALPGHDDLMRILKDNPEGNSDLDGICQMIGYAIAGLRLDEPWTSDALSALLGIAHYPGLDLPAELDRCWRRLAWKHGKLTLLDWWKERGLVSEGLVALVASGGDWINKYYPAPWLVEES